MAHAGEHRPRRRELSLLIAARFAPTRSPASRRVFCCAGKLFGNRSVLASILRDASRRDAPLDDSCAFLFCTRGCGASCARHSLRPLNFRRASHDAKLARPARRECGGKYALMSLRTVPRHRRSSSLPLCGEGKQIVSGANDVQGGAVGVYDATHPALRATPERALLVSSPRRSGEG